MAISNIKINWNANHFQCKGIRYNFQQPAINGPYQTLPNRMPFQNVLNIPNSINTSDSLICCNEKYEAKINRLIKDYFAAGNRYDGLTSFFVKTSESQKSFVVK
jgi:hypothetical protein